MKVIVPILILLGADIAAGFAVFDRVLQRDHEGGSPCDDFSGQWEGRCFAGENDYPDLLEIEQRGCRGLRIGHDDLEIGGRTTVIKEGNFGQEKVSYWADWGHDSGVMVIDIRAQGSDQSTEGNYRGRGQMTLVKADDALSKVTEFKMRLASGLAHTYQLVCDYKKSRDFN